MLSKLASIAQKPYLQNLNIENVKQIIAEFELDIDTADVNGTESLVFDSHPQRRWEILKLLDDDFLSSTMTELKYEVNSKQRRT